MMLGVILTVQRIAYPGLEFYSKERLLPWHQSYTRRIAVLVVPLMLAQLGGGIYWFLASGGPGASVYLGLIALLWAITLLRFAPLHQRISRGEGTDWLLHRLQTENWLRTFLWTGAFLWHLAVVCLSG